MQTQAVRQIKEMEDMHRVHNVEDAFDAQGVYDDIFKPVDLQGALCLNPSGRDTRVHTYEEVCGRPHLPVFGNDIDDQGIAHQPNQHDEGKEEGHQPGVCEEGVLLSILLIVGAALPLGEVRLGAVDPEPLRGVPQLLGRVHRGAARSVVERKVRAKAPRRDGGVREARRSG